MIKVFQLEENVFNIKRIDTFGCFNVINCYYDIENELVSLDRMFVDDTTRDMDEDDLFDLRRTIQKAVKYDDFFDLVYVEALQVFCDNNEPNQNYNKVIMDARNDIIISNWGIKSKEEILKLVKTDPIASSKLKPIYPFGYFL